MPSARLPESRSHAARRAGARLVRQRGRSGPAGAGGGSSGAWTRPRRRQTVRDGCRSSRLDALAGAWQGRGGDASREFLLRHGEASAAAASAVRNAADALAALRDDLWHAVDEKVAAAVAIEDRRQAERAEWLAATQTVTTGAGDRAVASELIDQQVKPFVDNDIRADWLTAMQKAMAAVSAAFDDATGALTGEPAAAVRGAGRSRARRRYRRRPGGAPAAEVAGTAPAAWPSPPAAASAARPAGANGRSGRADTLPHRSRSRRRCPQPPARCDRTPACARRRCPRCRHSVSSVADCPAPQADSPGSVLNSPTPSAVSSTVPTMRCPIRRRWRTRPRRGRTRPGRSGSTTRDTVDEEGDDESADRGRRTRRVPMRPPTSLSTRARRESVDETPRPSRSRRRRRHRCRRRTHRGTAAERRGARSRNAVRDRGRRAAPGRAVTTPLLE